MGELRLDIRPKNVSAIVKFTCSSGFRSGGGFRLVADERQWAAVEPFVREVEAAL